MFITPISKAMYKIYLRNLLLLSIILFTDMGKLHSATGYDIYEKYNSSNYLTNNNLYSEINFENIDYVLLNAAVFFRTNEIRKEHGLSELGFLQNLESSATMHAKDMIRRNFFDHTNPYDKSKTTPSDRGRLSGIINPSLAENIAENFGIEYEGGKSVYVIDAKKGFFSYEYNGPVIKNRTYLSFAQAIVLQWMNSPGHRENILSKKAVQLGCGMAFYRDNSFNNIAKFKAVQNFQWFNAARTK